ncbi:MAG: hypothetical protein NTX86_04260, partial [Candidatus Dependentiae bacterium]|nr:hypothetical protein [Candidatus Dependentiae bacterium]
DGKIFTARQAIKLGLIDTIGSAQQAIAVLKEKALIEGEIEWVHPLTKNSLIDVLGGSSDDEGSMFSYCMTQLCSFLEQRYLSNGVVQ